MRLIGLAKLRPWDGRHDETGKWLISWVAEVRDAHWKEAADVMGQFPRVQRGDGGTFLFPVPRSRVTVHVLIVFAQGVALITALKIREEAHGN